MAQTKKKRFDRTKAILWAAVAVLVILCGVLTISLHHQTSNTLADPVNVSLGTMDYTFTGNRAIKQDDASTNALRQLLVRNAKNDIRLGCKTSYYDVGAFNADKTQVFLKYGCSSPDSPMYAVKTAGVWKILSPTNHFDEFGIPDCAYVTQNNIDPEIAPVCVSNWTTATPQYQVR